MAKLIMPGRTVDGFSKAFIKRVRGVKRFEITRYGIHNLMTAIDISPHIPPFLKILSIAMINQYALQTGLIPDRSLNKEYDLYRTLADAFTRNRPDLLPQTAYYFTYEALSKLVSDASGRYDKNLFGESILTGDIYWVPRLSRMTIAVNQFINDPLLREMCISAITTYASRIAFEAYAKRQANAFVLQPLYSHKRGLYGFGWFSRRLMDARNDRLKRQAYNLDTLTGEIVNRGVAHHIEYDKSKVGDHYLIWVDTVSNTHRIRNPPRQVYFGQHIDINNYPGAAEDIRLLRNAKTAVIAGVHPPHWGDVNNQYYNPQAIRRFYWYQQMVQQHGDQWLDTLQARTQPPANFMPQYDV